MTQCHTMAHYRPHIDIVSGFGRVPQIRFLSPLDMDFSGEIPGSHFILLASAQSTRYQKETTPRDCARRLFYAIVLPDGNPPGLTVWRTIRRVSWLV